MSHIHRVLLVFAIVLIASACSVTTEQDEISGARPEIIFDGIEGIYTPAKGIDRGGPDLVDGLPYEASDPVRIQMRDVPRSDQAVDAIGQVQLRGGGRMEAPLPDHVMDLLREEAMLLPPSAAIEDPTAGGSVVADAAPGNVFFDSIDYNECCGGGGNVPPDPELAASNDYLIAVVNVAFEIYDTNGNSLVGPSTFASFFSSVPNCSGVFDPNVNYDEDAGRFIMGIDANGTHYCIAVSDSSDPTGTWTGFSFSTANRRDFFDYPHLGVGDEAVFMGANIFGVRTFKEGRVWAIDKTAMYNGNSPTIVSYSTGSESTPQPMIARGAGQGTWPAGDPHYIITDGPFNGQDYGIWSWSDPFGGGAPVKEGNVDLNAATGQTAGSPVDQPQQTGGSLQANDWRVQDAEYRDGYIWMSNAQACNPSGGTVNCARWAQIDPTGPTVASAGVVGSPGEYRSFPDLAVDACGNMMIGYSKTSTSIYPGVYAVGYDEFGGMGTEIEVKKGEIEYTSFESSAPRRWGDYTEMTIAPDGSTFWYLGEYSKNTGTTNGRWGTYIGQFSFGCDGGGNLPPTAAITTPPDCTLLVCSFSGSGSTDDDGTIVSYAWNFGDGNTGSGVAPSHEYGQEGTYNVSLTVTDDGGATDTDNYLLTVDDGIDNPPTASFEYSCTNLACDFTDTSTDSDGTVTEWDWDFGDTNTSTAQNPSHTYAAAGTYTVTLTVTDNGGGVDSALQAVTVSESSGITLSATGYKVRGLQKADLSWNDASGANVDVYRDGALITTTANDDFYTDNINVRGGGSYEYEVCEAGTTTCSNIATVVF